MKIALIVMLVLAITAVAFVLNLLRDAGEFKTITAVGNEHCSAVTGLTGTEDITIDYAAGTAFISSDDRRANVAGKPTPGAIFLYDLSADLNQVTNLTAGFDQEFHPHGLSLYVDSATVRWLHVVNHRRNGHFIEIFRFEENELIHQQSIAGEMMHSPNDIAAVGIRQFYVTNDHGNTSALGKTVEEYLQLAKSNVLYYDGSTFQEVADGIAYANGLQVSADGTRLYVAATVGRQVKVYERDPQNAKLQFVEDIELDTGVDNIEIDEQGVLWIGAHPQMLTFVEYAEDASQYSPSEVLRIIPQMEGAYRVERVFLSLGDDISGSSVAAHFGNSLLIGSVFDPHFLICQMN